VALKRPKGDPGTLLVLEHDSRILRDNPLGDPHLRKLAVWLPPQYHGAGRGSPGRRFPVLYDFAGFTGSGLSHANWKAFGDNLVERAARLIHEGKMAPAILVLPDCFTALGGNQYVNSPAIGDYADYLTKEIVPFVDAEFRTLASREHRGCFGKSSGGYGAIIHGMKYPRTWGAVADHSGDAYFDFVYWHDWPNTLNELAKYKRSKDRVKAFLEAVWKKEKLSGAETHCLMNLCMAATYDPDPRAPNGFRIPFDLDTGEVIPERWREWQRHDPINLVLKFKKNLQSLRGIYIDCGSKDQYHIHFGCRILSRRLAAAGIRHTYEEFDDNHSDIDYRMDVSLPFLSRVLR
jgi:enterochelin esterase-like enzyme